MAQRKGTKKPSKKPRKGHIPPQFLKHIEQERKKAKKKGTKKN